jgi:hypothetical protein
MKKNIKKVCKDATNDSKGDLPINRYRNNIELGSVPVCCYGITNIMYFKHRDRTIR